MIVIAPILSATNTLNNTNFLNNVIPGIKRKLFEFWNEEVSICDEFFINNPYIIRTGHFDYVNYYEHTILPRINPINSTTIVAITEFGLGSPNSQAIPVGGKLHCMVDGHLMNGNATPDPLLINRVTLVANHELVHALGNVRHEYCTNRNRNCALQQLREEELIAGIDRRLQLGICPECIGIITGIKAHRQRIL